MKRTIIQKKGTSTPSFVQIWQLVPNAKFDLPRLTPSLIFLTPSRIISSRTRELSILNLSNQVLYVMSRIVKMNLRFD